MGERLDKLLGRNKKTVAKVEKPSAPRFFVFALNRQRYDSWCHYNGVPPNGKNFYFISTGMYSNQLRGFRIETRDRIVVLENADLGNRYEQARKDALIASGGWVDIDLREKVLA